MANTHTTLSSLFTAIANKIRTKTGYTAEITADNFPDAIDSILTPTDGTIATKTSSDLTASGKTVTVPAGYYASDASKSVSAATQATPSISVSSSGLITASATQSAGYVSSGTKSNTKQLTTQAAKTITPSTSAQTAVSSGVYTTGAVTVKALSSYNVTPSTSSQTYTGKVTVAGDSDLVASNIKSGVSIFGVSGTCNDTVTEALSSSNISISGDYLYIYTDYNIKRVFGFSLTFAYFDSFQDSTLDPLYGQTVYYGSLHNITSTDGAGGTMLTLGAGQQSYENVTYGDHISVLVYPTYVRVYNRNISDLSIYDFADGFITYIPA